MQWCDIIHFNLNYSSVSFNFLMQQAHLFRIILICTLETAGWIISRHNVVPICSHALMVISSSVGACSILTWGS